jgi:hypothetical protein
MLLRNRRVFQGMVLPAKISDGVIGPHTHFDEQINPRDSSCKRSAKSPARKGSEFYERITVYIYERNKLPWGKGCAGSLSRASRRTRSETGCRAKYGSTVPAGACAS